MYLIFAYNENPGGGTNDLWGVSPTKSEATAVCAELSLNYEWVECLDCNQFAGKNKLVQFTKRNVTTAKESSTSKIQGHRIDDILQKLQETIRPRHNDLGPGADQTDWLL